ncbi:hypothetical protein [Thermoanaerobacterium sp. DL9XJH110]|uniref:hypothetical protein n=1 Tax=Thermoanaerobacterium sp. DL9XJH110 TaxID=3386643 RepID=UPI003BB673D5
MVQIDDAGSGSLVGGTCIGLYYDKKRFFKFDFIPLSLYTPDNFKKKLYQKHVVKIIDNFFRELSIPCDEPIEVCRGYIFDDLRDYLTMKKYKWKNAKIEGVLQEKVEETFADYAVSLGLPQSYVSYTKYPFHFHKLLRWVYADYEKRKNLCKTGWKSWQKYGNLPVDIFDGYLYKGGYFCLKCGRKIDPESRVKILRFFSNKENLLYLHLEC